MVHEGKIITYLPNSHQYLIGRDISLQEAKLVLDRLAEADRLRAQRTPLEKKLAELEQKDETREVLIKKTDLLHRVAGLCVESQKVFDELNAMMREVLHNCFSLTVADLDKIDFNEQTAIFKQLVEMCS